MTREAWVVLGLGFGDCGKGAAVDFLVRSRGATMVVRHHGGAQAGHRVVAPDGRAHVFSQFGAGSFVAGVRTHLGPAFLLHPGGMAEEAGHLAAAGVADIFERTTIDERALVITPFQQAAGRLRELARGSRGHGTCGVGVGECVADALCWPGDALRAGQLAHAGVVRERLRRQQGRKAAEWRAAGLPADPRAEAEGRFLTDPEAPERVLDAWATSLCVRKGTQPWRAQRDPSARLRVLGAAEAHALLARQEVLVCEGAQGVLLDQTWGFQPYTTWSDCTGGEAQRLLEGLGARVYRLGVTRAYATRHGPGPFPTHDPSWDQRLSEGPRVDDGWQGRFRCGPLDLVLLRYAVKVCGGLDGLALNGLDRIADPVAVCVAHAGGSEAEQPLGPGSAEHLARVRPCLIAVARDSLAEMLERSLGVPVWLEGWGPAATDRRWRVPPPV